jgi:hydrogenase assembly chaperone HypC/HupF
MCLSVPAKVIDVGGGRALVTSRGWTREVDASQLPVLPGDFVLVQGGVAMIRLAADEAKEMLDAWEELEALGDA